MTIFGKRSLKISYEMPIPFDLVTSTKRTFLESSNQDLSNDISFGLIR